MIKNNFLYEAEDPKSLEDLDIDFMTENEEKWKRRIISMLINKDGRWGPYKHAKYAKRLQNFIVKIVPPSIDPYFTAAVSFETGVVYVGQGLLIDKSKYYQLNVVLRHEIAHVLLRHQLRMAAKLSGKPYFEKLAHSHSFFDLINIVADFEISNKKYTAEDKAIMRSLFVNGRELKCLVTEMHRSAWQTLSLEEMFDKASAELETLKTELSKCDSAAVYRWTSSGRKVAADDLIYGQGAKIYRYADKFTPSYFWLPLEDYFKKSKTFNDPEKFPVQLKQFVLKVYEELKGLSAEKLKALQAEISVSDMTDAYKINDKLTLDIPEEKFWAMQVIKALLGNAAERPKLTVKRAEHSKQYKDAYNMIMKNCGKRGQCSIEDLGDILTALPAKPDTAE